MVGIPESKKEFTLFSSMTALLETVEDLFLAEAKVEKSVVLLKSANPLEFSLEFIVFAWLIYLFILRM
jgi:hypothetical protein